MIYRDHIHTLIFIIITYTPQSQSPKSFRHASSTSLFRFPFLGLSDTIPTHASYHIDIRYGIPINFYCFTCFTSCFCFTCSNSRVLFITDSSYYTNSAPPLSSVQCSCLGPKQGLKPPQHDMALWPGFGLSGALVWTYVRLVSSVYHSSDQNNLAWFQNKGYNHLSMTWHLPDVSTAPTRGHQLIHLMFWMHWHNWNQRIILQRCQKKKQTMTMPMILHRLSQMIMYLTQMRMMTFSSTPSML